MAAYGSSRKCRRAWKRIVLIVVLLGLAAVVWWQPRFAVRLIAALNQDVTFFVETEQPVVALTLDDGPHATITPRLLDLLAEHEAHASFFLIGQRVAGAEEVVRRIAREGHEIGNHHLAEQPSIRLPAREFERQLLQTHALLSPFGPLRLFRPGSGWFNRRMLDQLERHGYRCVLGTAYPEDLIRSPWYLSRHILFNIRPGSIIILHDGERRGTQTLAVLERVLPELRRRGYHVVTASDLMRSR